MARITRPDANVQSFGITTDGTGRTIYGSATQSDDLTDNLSAEYLKGWNTIGQKPPRQWFNGALFTNSQLVSYLFQMGIPEWNENQEYYTNSKCTSPINGFTYISKTGTAPSTPNPGTTDPSSDATNWRLAYLDTANTASYTPSADYHPATKKYVDDNAGDVFTTDFTGSNQNLVTSGYQKLPGGLILQWGLVTTNSSGLATFTFPVTYPNGIFRVLLTPSGPNSVATFGSATLSTAGVNCFQGNTGAGKTENVQVFTIGY